MALQQAFIEEIDPNELHFQEVVGRGAFGVVSRAKWRSIDVAVKLIETESEKKAFITELKQLSRVNHVNIVKLYGASTKQPVCLVMEYAEGGSLYNVLHGAAPNPLYSAAHAMSWCLQCARGVEYLHGMKPKPLVHRDLKPPNLLLISRGTVLKICDFGTACDAHTHMTNNKGSAAWMAPEVFEGSNYSEKCDVFSWGIIFWEVLTRRKPFDEIGGPAFRIMWAVHNGTRPPLIKNCPKPVEVLMTRCWSSIPMERPSMVEVTRIMSHLFQFFSGADEPLQYASANQHSNQQLNDAPMSAYDTPPNGPLSGHDSRNSTIQETIQHPSNMFGYAPVPMVTPSLPRNPVVVEDRNSRTSAPASLQGSCENLLDYRTPTSTAIAKDDHLSADLLNMNLQDASSAQAKIVPASATPTPIPPVRKHRRTGSHGTSAIVPETVQPPVHGHKRTGSSGSSAVVTSSSTAAAAVPPASMQHSITAPGNLDAGALTSSMAGAAATSASANRSVSCASGWPQNLPPSFDIEDSFLTNSSHYLAANHYLQPLPPCPTCPESVAIFQQHCQMTEEYLRLQAEIVFLSQRRKELLAERQQDEKEELNTRKLSSDYETLLNENDQLKLLQRNLKKQVDQIKAQSNHRL